MVTTLFPGVPGGPEVLALLFVVILLFGANKIPKLARSSGEAIGEFQKGREEVEQELEELRQGETKSSTGTSTATETETSTVSESSGTSSTSNDAGSVGSVGGGGGGGGGE